VRKFLKNEKWGIGCTLDEANKLKHIFKTQFSSQEDKIKSLDEQKSKKKTLISSPI
jgi:hypothetical protein